VLDSAQGCSVLGGDALMRELARALAPRRAVFLTDVDGVFDRPPEEERARLVRAVRVGGGDDDDETEWVLEGGGGGPGEAFSSPSSSVRLGGAADGAVDVSGGMRAKVEEAAAISREAGGAPVVVAKGGTDAALEALLRGADAFLGESGGDGDGSGSGGARLRATVVMAAVRRPGPPGA
jgi:isopentenyl phosphate kinase